MILSKVLVYFYLVFMNIGVFASMGPPRTVGANAMLIKSALNDYKIATDALISYHKEIQKTSSLCRHFSWTSTYKTDYHDFYYSSFFNKSPRERISFCMSSMQNLKGNGDLLRVSLKTLNYKLHDAVYANFAGSIDKLTKGLQNMEIQISETQNFLTKASKIFSFKYLEILSQDYQSAIANGELSGKIRGKCIYLKNQSQQLNLLALIIEGSNDYKAWLKLVERAQSLDQMSEVMRPLCTKDIPADYKALELRFTDKLNNIDSRLWTKTHCLNPANNDLKVLCTKIIDKKIELTPYIVNALGENSK